MLPSYNLNRKSIWRVAPMPRDTNGERIMRLVRRNFLRFAGATAIAPAFSRIACAQGYPTRPVRLIVGFPPGGGTDITARFIGQWLSERLGQPVVIENRPGAGSNIGTEAVVRAAADGYTLLLVSTAHAINATLYDRLNYNFLRDIAPVAGIIRVPNVMEVHPSVPAKTVPEFIAYARANPGNINVASGGNGTSQHLSAELFKMMTGVNLVHVPYRGAAPALTDLIGGQVQVMFENMLSSIEYIKAGKLRALAVTTAARSAALPDLPAVGDFVPGYESSAWYGVGAPKNTPAEIVEKLNKEITAALAEPKMNGRLADLGGTVLAGSPSDFGKLITDESEKWAKVVKFSGAKAE
jgi:tripartite-type tricarboxylate transporter receptor subunit TctC